MGRIEVEEDRCKGCELCISFCPKKVIVLAKHFNRLGYRPATMLERNPTIPLTTEKQQFDPPRDHSPSDKLAECSGCGICAHACPDAAITVYKERSKTSDLPLAS